VDLHTRSLDVLDDRTGVAFLQNIPSHPLPTARHPRADHSARAFHGTAPRLRAATACAFNLLTLSPASDTTNTISDRSPATLSTTRIINSPPCVGRRLLVCPHHHSHARGTFAPLVCLWVERRTRYWCCSPLYTMCFLVPWWDCLLTGLPGTVHTHATTAILHLRCLPCKHHNTCTGTAHCLAPTTTQPAGVCWLTFLLAWHTHASA